MIGATRDVEDRPLTICPGPDDSRPGPDFICIGAQKAGTSWLYDQLQHHADFWMPPVKELAYFSGHGGRYALAKELRAKAIADLDALNLQRAATADRRIDQLDLAFLADYIHLARRAKTSLARPLFTFTRFRPNIAWRLMGSGDGFEAYARLFTRKGARMAGDITPEYSMLTPAVVRQVTRAFPCAKIIFLARDPVQRFWSAVGMHVRQGKGTWPKTASAVERLLTSRRHASRSYQTEIVARWRQHVPPQRFGVFLFDDLVADPVQFRSRIITFLGGAPEKPSGDLYPDFNRKAEYAKHVLSPELRRAAADLLADELRASARVFGGAATTWPARYGL